MSNRIPPSVTPPSPNEWPITRRTITGITKDNQAKITAPNHGFTANDVNLTSVMFMQVKGMIQINGMPGRIQSVIDASNFTVDINSTSFYSYTSDGVFVIDTGSPPIETESFQIFNTPFQNIK